MTDLPRLDALRQSRVRHVIDHELGKFGGRIDEACLCEVDDRIIESIDNVYLLLEHGGSSAGWWASLHASLDACSTYNLGNEYPWTPVVVVHLATGARHIAEQIVWRDTLTTIDFTGAKP